MAYENSAGLRVHNQYGPRDTGGSQGMHKTEGYKNQYVVDQPSVLPYLFPRGGGVFVTGYDDTYVASGSVTSIKIGGLEVSSATEDSPIKIPDTNTGEVVVTGLTEGRVVIFFKKEAGYEEDKLPAWPGQYEELVSLTMDPTTASVVVAATKQLTVTPTPAGANGAVLWSTSDAAKATVSATGLVTGVAAGTATITATSVADPSKTATCAVTVTTS